MVLGWLEEEPVLSSLTGLVNSGLSISVLAKLLDELISDTKLDRETMRELAGKILDISWTRRNEDLLCTAVRTRSFSLL